jgi:hypothetical protein
MLIYDKSEQLTLYIWDRVAILIGGVEGDKMRNVATLDWLAHIFLYIKNYITRDPFNARMN